MLWRVLISTVSDRSGATMVEYGLIAALVAVAAVVGMGTIGESLAAIFSSVGGDMAAAAVSAGANE